GGGGMAGVGEVGLTPQTAVKFGIPYGAQSAPGAQARPELTKRLVEEAKLLEEAGASLLDFTNSGPVAGEAVVKAVAIPVIGGFGGGPWLDGRVRLVDTPLGYREEGPECQNRPQSNHPKAGPPPVLAPTH